MSSRTLRLGTRKSLLAWAQSSWVAREIERLNPGTHVELVGIETRGDRIQNVPLQQVAGKDFFVAELDEALTERRVDLNVHSMKDLSLDRPRHVVLGAVPKRENPRDVILFGPRVHERLARGETLRIGTSSPRRLENLPDFLKRALPQTGGTPKLKFVEIRGNVNTRLSRVHETEGSERYVDGVVLAFAGLIRLWRDDAGRKELERLLSGVRWMILPLKECPAAPAQGALAVECREDDAITRDALAKLHDEPSAEQARAERQILHDWGGGCHQRFGATGFALIPGMQALSVRGVRSNGTFVEETRWNAPDRAPGAVREWDGSAWRAQGESETLVTAPVTAEALFVAHSRAWVPGSSGRVWTSGSASWFKLAEQGVWVEGSAEGMGFDRLRATLAEGVLQLPASTGWAVLTHDQAREDWEMGRVFATYRIARESYPDAAKTALAQATDVYWSAGSQYDELGSIAPKSARHACGPGKTFSRLREAGIEAQVFPSIEEWRSWLKN